MCKLFKISKRPICFFLALLYCFVTFSQQTITVRVQVNRLPDGQFPTKIYQFSTVPGLVTMTLTNLSNTAQHIYLTGKLTGDNGVLVITSKNYRPPATLELAPLATKTLNAIEASYLFDANNLVFLSGNTSIKSSVFGEQGLPEGTYQLCIRAVDAATNAPLSDEDPIGCSNIFSITTLEQPMILNPFDEQDLPAMGVQSFPLRWTTPPGAPPSTEYLVRIVEVFGNRNPSDAIYSASTPFFETTVKGTPLFLYSVFQPQLQVGRTYAMMVVASDPLGNATFRKRGQSEVVQFTYGKQLSADDKNGQNPLLAGPTLEYANHRISGKISWTFKKSESASLSINTGSGEMTTVKPKVTQSVATDGKKNNSTVQAIETSPYLSVTASQSAFALQTALTPLISMNALAAVNADQTLSKPAESYVGRAVTSATASEVPLPQGFLSGSGSSLTNITYETIAVDSAAERFPLPAMPVALHAVMASGKQTNILLATGTTDKEGNFSLDFLDPSYASGNGAIALTLSVVSTDFDISDFNIPLSVLKNATADIGNHTLLAKSMRLFPKLIFDSAIADYENGYGIHIYRDAQELQKRPWLAYEGKNNGTTGTGSMVEIFSDSIGATARPGKLKLAGTLDALGAGRIFFGGNIYVVLVPSSSDYYTRSSVVNVLNLALPSNKIAVARVEYHLTHRPSQISGSVSLPLGETGRVPVPGAIVRVVYKKSDREPGNDPNDYFKQSATANKGTVAYNGGAESGAAPATPGWTNVSVKDPGVTSLQTMAYLGEKTGLVTAVLLEPKTANANSELTAKAVLNPAVIINDYTDVSKDSNAITTTVDEMGNYVIFLPPLKATAGITVEVISRPAEFRKFAIEAVGSNAEKATKTMDKGMSAIVDFTLKADIADVVARVVDDQGKPLNNAQIIFKGTTIGSTGSDGISYFSIYAGNHTLTLEKEGYVVKSVSLNVPQVSNNTEDKGYTSKWLGLSTTDKQKETLIRVSESQTVRASVSRGNSFSAAMFGIAAPSGNSSNAQTTSLYMGGLAFAFGVGPASSGSQYEVPRRMAVDMKDIGYLNKIVGKARFRIVDESNNAMAGVSITLFDSTHKTDDKGEWYYEGFGGSATLTLIPPKGTSFIAEQKMVTLKETGVEELIVVTMKKGILISGIVNSGIKPLPDTRILLDDQDFALITTDATGHYSIFTTPAPHKVSARKSGYIGVDKNAPGTPVNAFNFDLAGSNGRNYSTLLGFDIELDEATPESAGQEKWSGNFVKLKTVDNNIFMVSEDIRIPFSNLLVTFDAQKNPVPQNNIVKTDLTTLQIKLFGYLPVNISTGDVISFTRGSDGHGELNEKMSIAFDAVQGHRGWSMNDNNSLVLKMAGSATDQVIVFNSGGGSDVSQGFDLAGNTGDGAKGIVFGFGVMLKSGKVDKDGLDFSGTISTPDFGTIKSVSMPISHLMINRAITVSGVILNQDLLPALEMANWKATIEGLIFNEDGFKIGGSLNLNIPKSLASNVDFSDLSIAANGVFGGKFIIPNTGINILSLSDLNSEGSPLTFGRVGQSMVYRVAGKATYKINVPIFKSPFNVPSFEILTNGDFTVQTPINYTTSVGPFGFAITNLVIKSKDNTPSILVQGQFKADLSFIKFEVADITVKPSGGGPVFSVEKVGVRLDVPVLSTTVIVGFSDEGFEGEGGLGITGTPISGTVGFKYYKRPDGIELGAKFFANIIPIPIGGYFFLEGIGGGFTYSNTASNGGFSVDVRGKISMLGTGVACALNPVGLTVESAGILRGYGDLVLASFLQNGHAQVIFNGPEKTFTIKVNTTLSPMEGLARETVDGAVVISAKEGDEFVFLGCGYQTKLIGLIDNHGELAIAIRLKNPKTRDDLVSHYFEFAPQEYMVDRFSGVYINVAAQIGVAEKDALEFDYTIASAKLWFAYGYNASLLLNFEEGAYRLSLGGGVEMGIKACITELCAGISASLCIHVEGGRNNILGWNFKATGTGSASLTAGVGVGNCHPGCNEFVSVTDGCVGEPLISAAMFRSTWIFRNSMD